jgi:hypothetical protein
VIETEGARQTGQDQNFLRIRGRGERTRADRSATARGSRLRGGRTARFNLCRYVCDIGARTSRRNRVGRSARRWLGLRGDPGCEEKHE